MAKEKVLIAMSGGIDSSVAAMLLLQQGYELVGVTFRTFDSIRESCLAREKGCCSVESIMEARNLAGKLGFEHHIVDFRDTFRQHVIANFVDEYRHGHTPNPCVLCNSHIKWGVLLQEADKHGCSRIATGHYARIARHNGHLYLRKAADTHKDQTYFLWMLTEQNLARTLFPLGDLTKTEVRETALRHGFERLSQKTESQEICFIPDNDYRTFLQQEGVEQQDGRFVDANGIILGMHCGYANFTIGQRKGLGIALGYPAFVRHIRAEKNEVVLGHHDDLYQRFVPLRMTDGMRQRLLDFDNTGKPLRVQAQIRYRSKPQPAILNEQGLLFDEPVWAVSPGQSAVIYYDNLLIGGGIIEE